MRNLFDTSNVNKPCVSEDPTFKLTLNDCLACSGCITESDDFNIESNLDDLLLNDSRMSFIVSPQSKISIYRYISTSTPRISFLDFEKYLLFFIRENFNTEIIFDSSYGRELMYKSIFKELDTKNIIISDCPGTVMYIEKQAPHLVKYLSSTSTCQQILYKQLKETYCISIVPCYDKKIENMKDGTGIDLVITTFDFFKVLIRKGFEFQKVSYEPLEHELNQMNIGFNTGGVLEYILHTKYGKENNYDLVDYNELKYNPDQHKNADTKSFKSFQDEGKKEKVTLSTEDIKRNDKKHKKINKEEYFDLVKLDVPSIDSKNLCYGVTEYHSTQSGKTESFIRINGIENVVNFIKETKTKGFNYKVAEIYICSLGCMNGPGQLYSKDIYPDILEYNSQGKIFCKNKKLAEEEIQVRKFAEAKVKKINFNIKW